MLVVQKISRKGAGSYLGQGGQIARKGASRAPEANRGQRRGIVQKRHFAMFCYNNSLLILEQSKQKNLVHPCLPGKRATGGVACSEMVLL